ncbi:RNA-directed DNA polymerase [Candidatus Parcubacteria bacterium]|nr:MAG: RNA-directed DNA polymerase [Candidatus Parcubacteria bacterium]
MELSPTDLLSKGYFPEELPPPFQTVVLGQKFSKLEKQLSKVTKKFRQAHAKSSCIKYTAPKRGFSRRNFNIPNPFHFIELVRLLNDNKTSILKILKSSEYSIFLKERLRNDWNEFAKDRFVKSQDYIYELKTDIARYFPTIYTHSISWAIHGKKIAKSNKSNPSLWGNELDKKVRNLQDNQTIGIPVGPHVSRIIAELIGCEVDKKLKEWILKENLDVLVFRYIDDYFLYFSEESTGEKILNSLQSILDDFNLEINHNKTEVTKFPFGLEPKWVSDLRSFTIRKKNPEQIFDIMDFFSIALNYTNEHKNESILKYSLIKLRNTKIIDRNWDYFEAWLLKILLYNTNVLPEILSLFLLNQGKLNADRIKQAIEKLIVTSIKKKNNYEIAWSLWIAKSLKIKLSSQLVSGVFQLEDPISILIALDLINSNLIIGTTKKYLNSLGNSLSQNSLFNEYWLLAYESSIKGWLKIPKLNLQNDEFYKTLYKEKVSFYDSKKQIYYAPYSRRKKRTAKEKNNFIGFTRIFKRPSFY